MLTGVLQTFYWQYNILFKTKTFCGEVLKIILKGKTSNKNNQGKIVKTILTSWFKTENPGLFKDYQIIVEGRV